MSEEQSNEFDFKILTQEAKISIIYQTLTELETELFSLSLDEPIVEDPNHPEWEYNYKSTEISIRNLRKVFDELGGNYDFNRMKKSD